ncbi:MAG TPA: hypothetical protein VF461_13825 [Gemmatimonadaceae bacterium]
MATDTIIYDEQGHARHFRLDRNDTSFTGATPQDAAKLFIREQSDVLKVPTENMRSLDVRAAAAPVDENEALRFEAEKHLMDSTTVSYTQTMYGLPIFQAGMSVTVRTPDNAVTAATSTLHYDVAAAPPANSLAATNLNETAATGAYDEIVKKALPMAKGLRINRTRLMVYRYQAAKRIRNHASTKEEAGFGVEPPTLRLPAVPSTIKEGTHYVSVEVLFSYALPGWGLLNWQAFVEPDSLAVLYLRALVDGLVTALVFDRDPITKTGLLTTVPSASNVVLDPLRDSVALVDLSLSPTQKLIGTFVQLADVSAPSTTFPVTTSPFNFAYDARTDNFAAVNAYYHCDRFFRLVRDLGFTISSYFDGTSFPVRVDPHALGNVVNAQCQGNALGNGIGPVVFSLADTTNTANPIGIAADWRVVLHELAGHGILWDHVNSPNFGFAHSAGDGIAAILNDVDTEAPDRFVTFPWVNIGRRHDRPVNGWGIGGVNDVGGYSTEQILATIHFRLYRSLGGDSTWQPRRDFAARSTVYLIMRAVGQLTPATNANSHLAWEQHLETADAGVWTSTNPAGSYAGGAYHKVIRWAFEKQGLFRATGTPATAEGAAPPVDVYIDDGRQGQYQFLANHWSCTDIWNRTSVGAGGGVHQEPIVGSTNYAYVRIKNRGSRPATNVKVKGFHALPGVGLEYPTDWAPMTTAQLVAPNLAANDAVGVVVGPFKWTPSQVGHECMFFSVSANGDASNIDGGLTGPIAEWRLVPHDNNIAQRNVHPVLPALHKIPWAKLPFWIRNHSKAPVRLGVRVDMPPLLTKLGWKLDVPKLSKEHAMLKAGERLQVTAAVTEGKPFTMAMLEKGRNRDIVITVLQDGMPVGGMTFRIGAPAKKTTTK